MKKTTETFKALMKGRGWKPTLQLLKKKGKAITVMESPVAMGHYSAVILTGKGFQCESGRGGMSAAYAGNAPTFTPIRSAAKVLETVLRCNEPLDEDDKRPSEAEIVGDVLRKIEEVKKKK